MINGGRTTILGLLAGAAVLSAGAGCRRDAPVRVESKQRGVSWVAGREITAEALRPLLADHVNWIVQTPFGWQESGASPRVTLAATGRGLWGEQDVGLITTNDLALGLGIRTLLKPHVWIRRHGSQAADPTQIRMESEADWRQWFESYRAFVLHYAELAERCHMEILCVGTELGTEAVSREKDWRELIAAVRSVYHGKLTYAANWYREFETVRFWDALDYIGIQAYFPLSEAAKPSLDDLIEGWKPHVEAIQDVQSRFGKPVLFTEIGYRGVPEAAARPWEWPSRFESESAPPDPDLQAACYEAFFRAVWPLPWMAGAYWWKWFPDGRHWGEPDSTGFSPQGKPAEAVLARGYGGAAIDVPGTGD